MPKQTSIIAYNQRIQVSKVRMCLHVFDVFIARGVALPILEPRDYDRWLERDPGSTIGKGHGQMPMDLLRPLPADEMKAAKANQDVGNVRNNHPELLNSA